MGAWGTGILQNDTTADIWAEFKQLYNDGKSAIEIRKELEHAYHPDNDPEYYGEIWTGIAHGQWMCGALEDYTLKKVKAAVKKQWLVLLEDDEHLLKQRIKALEIFIQKIQTPRAAALKRKKIVERPAWFDAGDIIGIEIKPQLYAAAIVVKRNDYSHDGDNTLVFTDCISVKPITVEQVLQSNIFFLDIGLPSGYLRGYFNAIFSARNMSKRIKLAFKIGKIKIEDYLWLSAGTGIGDWKKIPELYQEQLEFLEKNQSAKPYEVSVFNFLHPDKEFDMKLIEWDKNEFRKKLS